MSIYNVDGDLLIAKTYVVPEMFGAVGDGTTDDTTALRNALKHAIDNSIKLLLVGTYYITDSLLTNADYGSNVVLDIEGTRPLKSFKYASDEYGGIKFQNGVNVFSGLTLGGSIYRTAFMPVSRSQTGSIFYNCQLSAFSFEYCSVSNILAFCHNTGLSGVTRITHSTFLTVYYFAKCDNGAYLCTDSVIAYNYINGGAEMNNNHCFEWFGFNGSTVTKNFIDYYQVIYYPNKTTEGNLTFQGGISEGNQYQAFRHLYAASSKVTRLSFSSFNDCFNWTDTTQLEKLANYDKIKYTDRNSVEHDAPPSILWVFSTADVKIKNAIIQSNCKNIVFVQSGVQSYYYAAAEFDGIIDDLTYDQAVVAADEIYNKGPLHNREVKIPWIKDVESLPSITANYTGYFVGQLISYDNKIYKFTHVYENGAWTNQWVDVSNVLFGTYNH